MRNNTPDSADIRWEVMKSMLDDFPQLRIRTKQYLFGNSHPEETNSTGPKDPEVRELMQKAVNEYHRERLRK